MFPEALYNILLPDAARKALSNFGCNLTIRHLIGCFNASFVMSILADAEQNLERRYTMRQAGIDLDAVEKRVCRLYGLKPDDLYGRGRQKTLAEARSLFCFWAVRELGMAQTALAERFSLTGPAISYAVRRGQRIARERGHKLLEKG